MATRKIYGSSAELQNYLIENIAPNYFDFSQVNNYRAGLFGYINEVISVITMDTHNAVNVARREFYPVSAENPKSFYKMAALQKIGLPTVTPARCKAILILDRDQVIENSTYKNGVYTCVIDKVMKIIADDRSLCLLYPIVIISNEYNGEWTHTIHYDKSVTNDLDKTKSSSYITNRTLNKDAHRYILMEVQLYQCERQIKSELVTKDSSIETVSLTFDFEGDLAGFEAFYVQNPDQSSPVQLKKLLQGQSMVQTPFCYYRMITDNQLEISFPRNIYFTPDLNSEIRLEIYTSLGKKGEFSTFEGDLACSMESEDYPYNNNMTFLGKTNGSASYAEDIPSKEEYREIVKAAYATNDTITTSNDIQILFDLYSKTLNKMFFRKKRDDSFERLYGAYIVLKDEKGNVVPANTLTLNMVISEFDSYNETSKRTILKPGNLFEYDPASDSATIYTGKKVHDLTITDDLSPFEGSSERFIYTNPFLIMCTLYPNLVGYYINTMAETRSVEYVYMNDSSITQFVGGNFSVNRHAIGGENFYKFSIQITSTTTDFSEKEIISIPKKEDADYYIRAKENGTITRIYYDEKIGVPFADILYKSGKTDRIQIGSYVDKNEPEIVDLPEDDKDEEPSLELPMEPIEDGYYYHTGYTLTVRVYESFIEGDIIAIKKVTDKGRIRAVTEIEHCLYDDGKYIPMVIEDFDEDKKIYTLVGYISTDDVFDSEHLTINHGIFSQSGNVATETSIPYNGIRMDVSVFYRYNDQNFSHKYSGFDYLKLHTLTNTYMENSEDGISLIQFVSFVRSVLSFNQIDDSTDDDKEDFTDITNIRIKDVPLVNAYWSKQGSNFDYMITSIREDYNVLQDIFFDLENNFGFDMKFYNTFGKSKFFRVGQKQNWNSLNCVNCSFYFGVYLSAITSQAAFLEKFRAYVKEYIESINTITPGQQSIYILNMTRSIQKKFKEIGYLEYYGFNIFNETAQKIEPIPNIEMTKELMMNYIPEFINIASHMENGSMVPNIDVEFLNPTDDAP